MKNNLRIKKCITLFLTFMKIGAFTFGGWVRYDPI